MTEHIPEAFGTWDGTKESIPGKKTADNFPDMRDSRNQRAFLGKVRRRKQAAAEVPAEDVTQSIHELLDEVQETVNEVSRLTDLLEIAQRINQLNQSLISAMRAVSPAHTASNEEPQDEVAP